MNSLMKTKPYSLNMNDILGTTFDNMFKNQYSPLDWDFTESKRMTDDVYVYNSSDGKERTIEFPLAGFSKEDINLYEKDNKLVVIAKRSSSDSYDHEYKKSMMYTLNKYEKNIKSATYKNGMLYVKLDLSIKDDEDTIGNRIEIE